MRRQGRVQGIPILSPPALASYFWQGKGSSVTAESQVAIPLQLQLSRGSSNSISALCSLRPRGGYPLGASSSCSHLCMERVCISFPRSRPRGDFSWRSGVLPCSPLDSPGLIAEPGCRTLSKHIQKTLSSRKPQGFRESLLPSPRVILPHLSAC